MKMINETGYKPKGQEMWVKFLFCITWAKAFLLLWFSVFSIYDMPFS